MNRKLTKAQTARKLRYTAEQFHQLYDQWKHTDPGARRLERKRKRAYRNRRRRNLNAHRQAYWMRVGAACERELMNRFHTRPFLMWEIGVQRMLALRRADRLAVWSFPVCVHEAKNFHAQLRATWDPKPPMNAHLQTYDKEEVVDSEPLHLSEECWNYLAAGGDQYAHNELPVLGSNQKIRLVGDEWEASDEE